MSAAQILNAHFNPQKLFKDFTDFQLLGAGANGVVYKAIRNQTPFAIKIIKTVDINSFLRESSAMACVRHPSIVEIFDAGTIGEYNYLITEFLDGTNLQQLIEQHKKLDSLQTFNILKSIGEALFELHKAGYLHRDIKPSNIIVTSTNEYKLIDFGLVSSDEKNGELISTTGTIGYASPEQLGLIKSGVDYRSDLYSLGILSYECLTGKTFFETKSNQEILQKQLKYHPPKLSTISEENNSKLFDIIEKLIKIDPDDRATSLDSLLIDLSNLDKSIKLNNKKIFGRDNELNQILKLWDNCKKNKGHVVAVKGLSGFGKSYLINEFLQQSKSSNYFLLKDKFDEFDRTPTAALSRSLNNYFNLVIKQSDENEVKLVKTRIKESLSDSPAVLLSLSDIAAKLYMSASENAQIQESEFTEDEFANIAADFILKYAVKTCENSILVYDDIQWAPPLAQKIFKSIISEIEKYPLLLLFSARTESPESEKVLTYLAESNNSLTVIELGPMDEQSLGKMISSKLGDRTVPDSILLKIKELSQGSPYLTEQFLRTLLENGVLFLSQGSWQVNEAILKQAPLPKDISELILRRLNLINENTKKAMQVASLLGTEFNLNIITEILNIDKNLFKSTWQETIKFGLIEYLGKETYAFSHDKILEAAFSGLSIEEKNNIHLKIANYLAKQDSASASEIAHHYIESNSELDFQITYEYSMMAGFESIQINADHMAYKFFIFCNNAYLKNKISLKNSEIFKLKFDLGKICTRINKMNEALNFLKESLTFTKSISKRLSVYNEIIQIQMLYTWDINDATENVKSAAQELGVPFQISKIRFAFSALIYLLRSVIAYMGYEKNTKNKIRIQQIQSLSHFLRIRILHGYTTGILLPVVLYYPQFIFYTLIIGNCEETVFIRSYYVLGFGFMKKFKWVDAMTKKNLELAKKLEDPYLTSHVRVEHALAYHVGGDIKMSHKLLKEILMTSEKWLTSDNYTRVLNNLVVSMWSQGQTKEIQSIIENNIMKINGLGPKASYFYNILAATYAIEGQNDKAVEYSIVSKNIIKQQPKFFENLLITTLYQYTHLLLQIESEKSFEEIELDVLNFYSLKIDPANTVTFQKILYLIIAQFYFHAFEKNNSNELETKFLKSLTDLELASKAIDTNMGLVLLKAGYNRIKGENFEAINLLKSIQSQIENIDSDFLSYSFHLEMARSLSPNNTNDFRLHSLSALDICQKNNWKLRDKNCKAVLSIQEEASNKTNYSQTQYSVVESMQSNFADSLLKVSLAASQSIEPEQQAKLALDEMIKLLKAERGFLFNYVKDKDSLEVHVGRNDNGIDLKSLDGFSKTIMNELLANKEPVILLADDKGKFSQSESINAKGLKSIMAVPMFLRNEFIGAAYFDSQVAKGLFSKEDFEICQGLCNHITLSQEIARLAAMKAEKIVFEKDIAMTATVQALLFPRLDTYENQNVKVSGAYLPSYICSGDWWWYSQVSESKLRVYLVDVTGHGPASALVTSTIATQTRVAEANMKIDEFLIYLNAALFGQLRGRYCATASAIEIDTKTGKLDFWSAASPPISIVNSAGETRIIDPSGPLLGSQLELTSLGYFSEQLQKGDRLAIFSDGLLEIPSANGMRYNLKGLLKKIEKSHNQAIELAKNEIIEQTMKSVFDLKKVDDMTLVLIDFAA